MEVDAEVPRMEMSSYGSVQVGEGAFWISVGDPSGLGWVQGWMQILGSLQGWMGSAVGVDEEVPDRDWDRCGAACRGSQISVGMDVGGPG